MKPLTKYNRVAGYLNKIYDLLNDYFFDGELERPVITIQSTPRAYGHFTLFDAWDVRGAGEREINIGAGTLDRPIENIVATLLHEMCHQWNDMHQIQDCSRGGMYHNKFFKAAAETHGLNVSRSEKYGWSVTSPSDDLIEFVLLNDLVEIELNRNDPHGFHMGGSNTGDGTATPPPAAKTNSRRYVCPGCGTIVRATKDVNLICGDCLMPLLKTN